MRRRKDDNREIFRALALVTQFGISMLVPICLMTALGLFLDRKWGTRYLVIVGFCLGALAGGQSIYRMSGKFFRDTGEGKGHASCGESQGDAEEKK